jgi:hypothetical protein
MNFDQDRLEEKTFWDAYLSGKPQEETNHWHLNPIAFIKTLWRNVLDGKYYNIEMWEVFFKRNEFNEINKGYLKYFLRQNKVNSMRIVRWNCISQLGLMILIILTRLYGINYNKDELIFDVGLENLVFTSIWLFFGCLYYAYFWLLIERPDFMNLLIYCLIIYLPKMRIHYGWVLDSVY